LPHRALPADGGRGAVRDDYGEPADLDSIRLILDYPDGRVALAGAPARAFPEAFTDSAADVIAGDLEHAVTWS
jgi:hypothetical protein